MFKLVLIVTDGVSLSSRENREALEKIAELVEKYKETMYIGISLQRKLSGYDKDRS